MKRFLFCAGVLALAASCTESEFDSSFVQNEPTKGITFQAVEAEGDATTRGGFVPDGDAMVPFWYAEKDQIAIWATGVTNDGTDFGDAFITANNVAYKATKSAKSGQFTALQPDKLLEFNAGVDKEAPAQFFALYPQSLAATATEFASGKFTVDLKSIALAAQTQKDLMGDGIYDNVVKYSVSTAYPANDYDAVGEKVDLNFERVLSGVVFSTKNANQYTGEKGIFGKLKKITFTAKGSLLDGSANDASKLTMGDQDGEATLVVDVTDITKPTPKLTLTDGKGASEVVLTVGDASGLEWSDAAKAYMVIAPVTREKAEFVTAKYEFANITFTEAVQTSNSSEAGVFHEFKPLDINEYKYLITNETTSGTSNDRALIINDGTLSDIIDGTNVKWDNALVAFSKFGTIVANVALSDAELAKLQLFTNLKKVTLAKNATIPAKTFEGLSTLTTIDMPMVTKIAPNAFVAQTALVTLNLPAYAFEDENVNKLFFNDNTKADITTLDLSSVMSMIPDYGILRSLSFTGYTALETVTLNSKEAIKLSSNIFKGCTNLETVKGTVILSDGAFDGCSELATINVEGTVIPSNAFNDCAKLTSVLVGKNQIAPTEVGESAFAGAVKLEYMDLSNVTKLGESAFAGATEFVRSAKGAIDLKVGAAFIPTSAFEGTAVELVEFTNATSIAPGIFKTCAVLKQVRFVKTFDVADANIPVAAAAGAWNGTFGATPEAVDFFYADGQKYLNGVKLTLKYKDSGDENKLKDATAITFKGAYKK